MFKVNNRNTRARCEICSKLANTDTRMTPSLDESEGGYVEEESKWIGEPYIETEFNWRVGISVSRKKITTAKLIGQLHSAREIQCHFLALFSDELFEKLFYK